MAQLEYPNNDANAPRELAVRILDLELAGSFTPDRAIGYALVAIFDVLLCINDSINELTDVVAKR